MTDQDPRDAPTDPEPEAPQPAPAPNKALRKAAWVVLFALFALLISAALGEYFAPGGEQGTEVRLDQEELQVRFVGGSLVLARQGTVPSPGVEGQYRDALRSLEQAVADLDGTTRDAWEVSLSTLRGEAPDPERLARLKKDGDEAEKALATVSDPSSPPADRDAARARLGDDFNGRVARALPNDEGFLERLYPPSEAILRAGVLVVAFGAGALGFALLVVFGALLAQGKLKPVGYPAGGLTEASADRYALRMAVFLGLFTTVPALVAVGIGQGTAVGWPLVVGSLVFAIAFAWAQRVPLFGESDGWKKLIGDTKNVPKLAGIGVAAFLANLPIVFVLALVFQYLFRFLPTPSHPVSSEIAAGASPGQLIALFILAAVFAPLLEELSFRGLLFPALGRYMPLWGAGVLSGLLFAAIHPQGPVLWAGIAAIGCMAAYVTHLTGSLIPAIVMHAVHNAFILTLALLIFL